MKILFLSRWFPYPPNNGSKIRILNLLRVLADNHRISLLSFDDEPEKPAQVEGLETICERVITVPWKAFDPTSKRSVLGFFNLKPRSLIDTFSNEMAEQLQALLAEQAFDVVIASEIETASYYPYFNGQAAIFDEIEIGIPLDRYLKASSIRGRFRDGINWLKLKHYLKRMLKYYPVCTVASADERKLVIDIGIPSEQVTTIPNFIDPADYQSFSGRWKTNTLIFTGAFRYRPNYEAMVWFLDKVFPAVLDSVPDVQMVVTGDHMDLPLPRVKNVVKTGYVDNIRPLISQAAVSIVPMQTGGGTRLKILEAMALKTAVVSTSKGAQGIEVTHEKDILLADTPQAFSQAVIQLLQDKHQAEELARQGTKLLEAHYTPQAVSAKYELLLQKALQKHPA
jgi:glycosyltransferase involved in cell wall biosynthesis